MKKITIVILTMISLKLFSSPINVETAKIVAENFMKQRRNTPNEILSVEIEKSNDQISFFAINFAEGGWVLVAPDDSYKPILGYSFNGTYKCIDKKPGSFELWIDNKKEQINATSNLKSANTQIYLDDWDKYQKSNILKSSLVYTPGNSLLNTPARGQVEWAQDGNFNGTCTRSYNKFCPESDKDDCEDNCDSRHLVGCGAVAAGQIMWYWEWPHSSKYRTYNWSLMPTSLLGTSSEPEENEIANLLRDIGRNDAADMTYWCSGVWTTTNKLRDALSNRFNYKGVDKRVRKDWTDEAWKQILRAEIDAERPIIYRGGDVIDIDDWQDWGSVHYFVCDGYDASDPDLFHFNFGWGRSWISYNTMFLSIDDLTPADDGTDEYNKSQQAIIGISPSYNHVSCEDIPQNISNVSYSIVSDDKEEYAHNVIDLPANNKTLSVSPEGYLVLSAGNSIMLKPGFSVQAGGEFHAFISPPNCSDECGLELNAITNALRKGDEVNGSAGLVATNSNSFEIVVINRWDIIVYQGAGTVLENDVTRIWDGEGADMQAVYVAFITLRNNCGEKKEIKQDITVLMGGTKSTNIELDSISSKDFYFSSSLFEDNYNELPDKGEPPFKIFPNPNNGTFYFEFTSELPDRIMMYNLQGQLIDEIIKINSTKIQYDLTTTTYKSGTYIVRLIFGSNIYSRKIIIN